MTLVFMKEWDAAVEKTLRDFYDTLSEKDRRRFAAVQARQLGHGGVTYLAKVLGCFAAHDQAGTGGTRSSAP
jgi:hypothetical protein